MISSILALCCLAFMAGLAVYADRHIAPGETRLPMQWSVKGKVNWTAPRRLALALPPFLFALLMAGTALLSDGDADRQTAILALAIIGPAVQVLHLTLISRNRR